MADLRSKILILVEGAKTDVQLMEKLLMLYQFDEKYQIVSYNTNIYTLYQEMFHENDPDSMDLLQVLKARESDSDRRKIFDEAYSDILLVFDLDPQDPAYTPEKIRRMAEHFVESSDMGKLYLNYPMVEAFYHMEEIPDPKFEDYYATLEQLRSGSYKRRVNRENRNHDYRKFAVNTEECSTVILQNVEKAQKLCGMQNRLLPTQLDILNQEIALLNEEQRVSVLCTCTFFIPEYNENLLKDVYEA